MKKQKQDEYIRELLLRLSNTTDTAKQNLLVDMINIYERGVV